MDNAQRVESLKRRYGRSLPPTKHKGGMGGKKNDEDWNA